MIQLIHKNRKDIETVCRELRIKRLDVFGSAASSDGNFDPASSDIDFIVEFADPESPPGLLCRYLELAEQLEGILGKKVDVITPQSIRNPYFRKSIDESREAVYAA